MDFVTTALDAYLGGISEQDAPTPIFHILDGPYATVAAAMLRLDVLALMQSAANRFCELVDRPVRRRILAKIEKSVQDAETARMIREAVVGARTPETVEELELRFARVRTILGWLEKLGVVHRGDGGLVLQGPAPLNEPAVGATAVPPRVPPLKEYYPSADMPLSADQARFLGDLRTAAKGGRPVDIEGNYTYGFIIIRGLVDEYPASLSELSETLSYFARHYPKTPLGNYAVDWAADVALLQGDFESAFNILDLEGIRLEMYLNLAPLVGHPPLRTENLRKWIGAKDTLTETGSHNLESIDAVVQGQLDDFHNREGVSLVFRWWQRLFHERVPGDPPPAWDPRFASQTDQAEWLDSVLRADEFRTRGLYAEPKQAFRGMRGAERAIRWPMGWAPLTFYESIMLIQMRSLYREAENTVREGRGLPRVGEGWVSEVELYRRLCDEFPDEVITHQARPRWLGMQSLDIYFPSRRIAVEYQGAQHSKPVDLFGGADAFAKQQARDARKRAICAEEGVTLIEVFPSYDLDFVVREIRGLPAMANSPFETGEVGARLLDQEP